VTADGHPHWVGGISTVQGGSSQNRVLFYGVALTPVLMGGDPIGGVSEPLDTGSGNIDFDYRFSPLGTHYLAPAKLDAPSTVDGIMVLNGDALMAGGGIVREGSPIPAAVGGLPGENWDNFDYVGVTEDLDYLFTGDTDGDTATDEFVVVSGQIELREGDLLDTDEGLLPISGSIESGYMNAQADWAVVWDVNDATGNVEALILNGKLILKEGDAVDLDGDGVEEPGSILANFTGIAAMEVGDRHDHNLVDIYFTADIDVAGTSSSSDDIEAVFRLTAEAEEVAAKVVPLDIKPGSCPNSHNPENNGVLPVTIAGSSDLDVATIDISTLLIARADGVGEAVAPNEGPTGPHTVFEDATTPFMVEECICEPLYGDGIYDLSMKFNSTALRESLDLNAFGHGDFVELVVTGFTLEGQPFRGSDCLRIVGGGPAEITTVVGDGGESTNLRFGSSHDRTGGGIPLPGTSAADPAGDGENSPGRRAGQRSSWKQPNRRN
jgi:hypothetical protein